MPIVYHPPQPIQARRLIPSFAEAADFYLNVCTILNLSRTLHAKIDMRDLRGGISLPEFSGCHIKIKINLRNFLVEIEIL